MNNNHGRRRTRRVRQQRKQQAKAQISRILLTVGLMALIAVVSIGGTIAWLTAQTQKITNTFTTSTIGVSLDETTGNEYKMVPGKELPKDPKVTLTAGSEAGWLFVKVTEDFDSVTIDSKTYSFADYLDYSVDTTTEGKKWTALGNDYPGVYFIENPTSDAYPVLTGNKVTVKNSVTKEMMAALKTTNSEGDEVTNYPELIIQAYTIQHEGFEPEVSDGASAPTAQQVLAAAEEAWKAIPKPTTSGN